jgi:hypothetical protein
VSLIKDMRRQKAIYWARSDSSNEFNQWGFVDPVQIKCRWEDRNDQFLNAQGTTIISKSIVYTDRVVREGDWLQLAVLQSGTPSDPRSATGALEVKAFASIPDIEAKEILYKAIL